MPATTRRIDLAALDPSSQRDHSAAALAYGMTRHIDDDGLAGAIRELTAEVKGLRDDLRREILQREVSKLPQPIQEEVK